MKPIYLLLFTLFSKISISQTVTTTDASGTTTTANTSTPAGNTIANTALDSAFASKPIVQPGMWYVGRVFRLRFNGVFSTTILAPTMAHQLKLNNTSIGSTGAVSLLLNLSNRQWGGYVDIIVQSVGASGTVEVQGLSIMQTTLGNSVILPIANTSTYTIDMTVPQTLSLTAQWGAASSSNSITLRQLIFK